jgi:hypothetical protein
VNGRLFLNNVSLGIYGEAVQIGIPRRQGAHARANGGDGAASAPVAGLNLRTTAALHRDPAVALVSNNPYSFDPPRAPGTRPALDGGRSASSCSTGRFPGQRSART